MKAFSTLFGVEFRLSLRDMNMPIFAVIMPVVVMLIIGMVFGGQPAFEGANYTFVAQSVGAVSAIAICAGGAMGLPLVVSNYRYRKILKRYFVTPVSARMILAVQVTIYSVYALVAMVLVFGVAALFFGYQFTGSWLAFVGSYVLVLAATLALGMMVGGLAPNEKMAGVLTSVLYFPMLLLSGTTLPYEVMPQAVQRVADFLPLTQGVKLLKATSLGLPIDQAIVPVIVMVVWAVVCTAIAVRFFKWE
ncbi:MULTISPECIES: ABC transporter permease [Gordonibacter]|uniref:Transport permease protein n=1 Tax=Gordonibacter faecis TaxID=3047475 RepID=A0ABT7DMX7_9ACTN|nr:MULTISPECIES: ABC transporter permease [unclassified Gordonibacter]MDJ1649908.1 ABC transporter permease [Gordonibacter sp. KGMB12511]